MNNYYEQYPVNGVKFDVQLTPETIKTLYTVVGIFSTSIVLAAIIRSRG